MLDPCLPTVEILELEPQEYIKFTLRNTNITMANTLRCARPLPARWGLAGHHCTPQNTTPPHAQGVGPQLQTPHGGPPPRRGPILFPPQLGQTPGTVGAVGLPPPSRARRDVVWCATPRLCLRRVMQAEVPILAVDIVNLERNVSAGGMACCCLCWGGVDGPKHSMGGLAIQYPPPPAKAAGPGWMAQPGSCP